MNLTGILPALLSDPAAAEVVANVRARGAVDVVGPVGVRPPLLAAMAGATSTGDRAAGVSGPATGSRPLVVVTATGREADELAASVQAYLPDELADVVAVLPAWETLPHERLSPRSDTVAERLAVFRRLAHPAEDVGHAGRSACSSCRCGRCCSRWSRGSGDLEPVELSTGDERRPDRRRGAARRGGLPARRHGREARRVRGARRHPRRLPAHRGPPAARGVLGRGRSRRSAGSPSPTSAASRSPSTACGRRRAARSC